MATVTVNSITINNSSYQSYGPFRGKSLLNSVDLGYAPWTNNSMYQAFTSCYNLKSVVNINENVTNMYSTFQSCSNLTTAPVIPNSVTDMLSTFNSCSKLKGNIYVYSTKITAAGQCFYGTTLAKTLYLPYNATLGIYTATFNSFNTAGYKTTTTLNGVTVRENPNFINSNNWWFDNYNNIIYRRITDDSTLTVPNTISGKSVKFDVTDPHFVNTLLTSIDFNNTPIIGNMAAKFDQFRLLTSVTNINTNSEINNMYLTFRYCNNITIAPAIPNSVTNMHSTFYGCDMITIAPAIPNSVTDMSSTFSYCNNLITAPIIPNSVTNMSSTFENCRNNLTAAPEIPNSVTNMFRTFAACLKLQGNIYIHSENITTATYCFLSTNASLRKNVYIPFKYANNMNTLTYNSFIQAGYKTDGTVNGVWLMDINQ